MREFFAGHALNFVQLVLAHIQKPFFFLGRYLGGLQLGF